MKRFIVLLILLLALSILLRGFFVQTYVEHPFTRTLESDGFMVFPNLLTEDQIKVYKQLAKTQDVITIKEDIISNPRILKELRKHIGQDYEFQDYIWLINKSFVHTCHRDNNGLFFNKDQVHPSYTLLIYLEDMDANLDVIPGSHKNRWLNYVNLTDITQSIHIPKGSAILFDANLIHSGSFNSKENNPRIQMKVTHKNDRKHISYYEDFNKYANSDNHVPYSIRRSQKHITCQFPFMSDLTQDINIMTARGTSQGSNIPFSQKLFSFLFYGDWNFYDLKDGM